MPKKRPEVDVFDELEETVEYEDEEVKVPEKIPIQKKEVSELEPYVVSQLPTKVLRSGVVDGKNYEFITLEEALSEILQHVRKIKKAVA